jgi:hypothetical protein
MGQFTERYEKLQTWAVLPAEPLAPENDTERLETAPTASPADLGAGSASVSVTLTPARPAQTGDQDTPG